MFLIHLKEEKLVSAGIDINLELCICEGIVVKSLYFKLNFSEKILDISSLKWTGVDLGRV